MKYLFLFTISPVQAFIAQARKTQDLYAGSFILSHLCRVAAEKARTAYNARIVFPHLDNEALINRFLAVVDDSNREKNLAMGRDVEETVRDTLRQMAEEILVRMKISCSPSFIQHYYNQVENFWQIFWVFQEYPEGAFADSYVKIEQALGAIKNVKKFASFEQEPARKCSITGEHNVLFYREGQKNRFDPDFAISLPAELPPKYLDEREKLGAIAFIKRCAGKYFLTDEFFRKYPSIKFIEEFPSTADIALMDVLYEHLLPEKRKLVNAAALFELKNNRPLPSNLSYLEQKETKKAFEKFQKDNIYLTPYYALLLFDGDNMGRWLAGDYLNNGNNNLESFQNNLSRQLGLFAEAARNEVLCEPAGRTVYAGGDDFLGLINIRHLFAILKELRRRFDEVDLSRYTDHRITFSAGVVVAHWKTPLGEVLSRARQMEQKAKGPDGGKDALALAVLKHSGEIHEAVFKWKNDGVYSVDLLAGLVDKIASSRKYSKNKANDPDTDEQKFSSSFIKVLNLELAKLMDEDGYFLEDGPVLAEIKRLVARSCMIKRRPGESPEAYKRRKEQEVKNFYNDIERLYYSSNNLKNFLDALNLVDFLAREVR